MAIRPHGSIGLVSCGSSTCVDSRAESNMRRGALSQMYMANGVFWTRKLSPHACVGSIVARVGRGALGVS